MHTYAHGSNPSYSRTLKDSNCKHIAVLLHPYMADDGRITCPYTADNIWTVRPSDFQPNVQKGSHPRKFHIPLGIDLITNFGRYKCTYLDHGKNKIVFRVANLKLPQMPLCVLKLSGPYAPCEDEWAVDPEPATTARFERRYHPIKICPSIAKTEWCAQMDSNDRLVQYWFAWISEYVTPLIQYIEDRSQSAQVCILVSLYKQVMLATHGYLFADNGLTNFGVTESSTANTIVILDVEYSCASDRIDKHMMEACCLNAWWTKLYEICDREVVDGVRKLWEGEANFSLHDIADKLSRLYLPPHHRHIRSYEGITPASIVELFDDPNAADHAMMDVRWLASNFMAGTLRSTRLDENGRSRPLGVDQAVQAPMEKIKIIKEVTSRIRKNYIVWPNDVVPLKTLTTIIADSKKDCGFWMQSKTPIRKSRHDCIRKRFRTYLFQMCGCYEFVVFWIRVRPSPKSLRIFRQYFEGRWHSEPSDSDERMQQLNWAVDTVAGVLWEPIESQCGDGARCETAERESDFAEKPMV